MDPLRWIAGAAWRKAFLWIGILSGMLLGRPRQQPREIRVFLCSQSFTIPIFSLLAVHIQGSGAAKLGNPRFTLKTI
jgi:hypothetical protein